VTNSVPDSIDDPYGPGPSDIQPPVIVWPDFSHQYLGWSRNFQPSGLAAPINSSLTEEDRKVLAEVEPEFRELEMQNIETARKSWEAKPGKRQVVKVESVIPLRVLHPKNPLSLTSSSDQASEASSSEPFGGGSDCSDNDPTVKLKDLQSESEYDSEFDYQPEKEKETKKEVKGLLITKGFYGNYKLLPQLLQDFEADMMSTSTLRST
jgi:hypothetical protein